MQYKNKKLSCVLPEPDDNTAKIGHYMYYVLHTAKFHFSALTFYQSVPYQAPILSFVYSIRCAITNKRV